MYKQCVCVGRVGTRVIGSAKSREHSTCNLYFDIDNI